MTKLEAIEEPTPLEEAKEQIKYAIPISFTTVCRIVVYTTATAFLGHISTNSLAAAGLGNIVNDFFAVFVQSAGYTVVPLCSQAWGAGNKPLLAVWLQISIVVMALSCIVFTPIIILSTEPFLAACGIDAEVSALAGKYVQVTVFSIFPTSLFMSLRLYLQSMGSVQPSLYICVICSLLNFVFMYVMTRVVDLGIQGPALAVVATQTLQPLLLIAYLQLTQFHREAWTPWRISSFTPARLREYNSMLWGMYSSMAVDTYVSGGICFMAGLMGTVDVAAQGILYSMWGVLWAFSWGIGSALTTRSAHHLGAAAPKMARQSYFVATGLMFVAVVIIVGLD